MNIPGNPSAQAQWEHIRKGATKRQNPKIENQKSLDHSKTPPLTPSSGKNGDPLTSPSTEDISSTRRDDVITEEDDVMQDKDAGPVTIEELEAEIEEELKKQEENPFKIDLQELNSLQEVYLSSYCDYRTFSF